MAVKKRTPKVKKYKSIQTATKARRVTGSLASRKVSTAVSRSSKIKRGPQAGGAGSLSDIIVRTINGIKVPISNGDKKKKK